MSSFTKFPKIADFRSAIKKIKQRTSYSGKDINGDPIYNNSGRFPKLTFYGTTKLHGTNAAISYDPISNEFHAQSRERVLSEQSDNNGFCSFVNRLPDSVLRELVSLAGENPNNKRVTIFGEWVGPGIQPDNVAIGKIATKMFVIFAVLIGQTNAGELDESSDEEIFDDRTWVPIETMPPILSEEANISRVYISTSVSPIFKIEVDFNVPAYAQDELSNLTLEVEALCPVSKYFGVMGVGEGIVWKCLEEGWTDSKFWFKTKGVKHTASKVKAIAPVDLTKVKGIEEFLEYSLTENRLNQGFNYLREMNLPIERKSVGEFIGWMIKDITTEEAEVLSGSMLTVKDVSSSIANKSRQWFFDKLNTKLN